VNSRESKALKEAAGTQDFILSTVNADLDWGVFVAALRPTGTLCFVGIPPSPVSVHAFPLISGLRSISGNPTGSPYRLKEMLDVAARHGVKAVTESFPMAQANAAIEKVKRNKVRYRRIRNRLQDWIGRAVFHPKKQISLIGDSGCLVGWPVEQPFLVGD
jgi:uncharacterized zinc-type alcohol dehydrogenase-like protein